MKCNNEEASKGYFMAHIEGQFLRRQYSKAPHGLTLSVVRHALLLLAPHAFCGTQVWFSLRNKM